MSMNKTKYGKYILTPAREESPSAASAAAMPVKLSGLKDWGDIGHRMKWSFVLEPTSMIEAAHSHDFDEFLVFLSSDPANSNDFAAEAELSLGDEREMQIVNSPTVVCLPKGLVHGPLNFKTVIKPVLFCQIYLAREYVEKPVS